MGNSLLLLRKRGGYGANLFSGDNANFDGGTVGDWVTGGSNTLAADTGQARSGSYSAKATYQDNVNLCYQDETLSGAGKWELSAYVYIPAGWDGGTIKCQFVGFTGGSELSVTSTDAEGVWTLIKTKESVVAGDLSGSLRIVIFGEPSAGKFIYIDDIAIRKVLG